MPSFTLGWFFGKSMVGDRFSANQVFLNDPFQHLG
jgi:hypothetical protein